MPLFTQVVAYIPHGHCYLWESDLVLLHLISDALTGLAYFSIPLVLLFFIRKRPDIPFPWVFGLFSAFILACGTTHFMAIWTLWHPDYWISGATKAFTAWVSIATAVQLVPLIPKALALPSPGQLQAANDQLLHEIEERRVAETTLRSIFAAKHDLVTVRDRDGRCLSIAPTKFNSWITGSKDAMLNKTLHDIMPITVADRLLSGIHTALETQKNVVCDYSVTIREKETWFSASISALEVDTVVLVVRDVTQHRQAEIALQFNQQRLQLALEASGDGLWDWNIQTDEVYLSPNWLKMLGYGPDELPSSPKIWERLLHPEEKSAVLERLSAYLDKREATYHFDYRLRTRSGDWKWVSNYGKVVEWDETGKPIRMVGTHRDINQRKQRTQAILAESEARFRSAFDNADVGMALVAPDGQFLRVNQACCKILGYTQDALLHKNISSVTHPDDVGDDWAKVRRLLSEEDRTYRAERRYLSPGGDVIWVVLGVSVVRDSHGKPLYFVSQIQDDTARHLYEAQLAHQAFHDSLTKLPNRTLFQQRLEQEIQRAKRDENYLFAVLFLDLDRFKSINDSLGHAAGDNLLIEVGKRLQQVTREIDLVARFGGDEFAILLANVNGMAGVFYVAERILEEFQRPFALSGGEYIVGGSIGITMNDIEAMTSDSVMQAADIALYRSKNLGRGRYEVYDQEIGNEVRNRLHLENALRLAIEQDQLIVVYQPVVDIQTEQILGFEALMRWQEPDGTFVSPGAFIQVAEESGLIVPIDWVIMRKACRQMQCWRENNLMTQPWLSVNLSSHQFNLTNCVDQVKSILQETGLDPKFLKIEITETAFIQHSDMAAKILASLKLLGITIALDDFGTGYSSLNYLHRFPVDTLKIDKSFVEEIVENRQSIEIVRTLVALSRSLAIDIVAEGVETLLQQQILLELGCPAVQGFLLHRPLTTTQVEGLYI